MTELIQFFSDNLQMIYIVILMIFVGVEVIGHVPAVLHTPLMSGANALSGVVIIGAILVMLDTDPDNCGSCGYRCATGEVCAEGQCGPESEPDPGDGCGQLAIGFVG